MNSFHQVSTMFLHVTAATYVSDYIIFVRFNDGVEGLVDLREELYGELFEPLKDVEAFKAFRVDPETETIVWDNGADFAPEFFLDRVQVASDHEREPHAAIPI